MHELGYVFADTYLREPEKSGSLCVFRKIFFHIPSLRRDVLHWGEEEAADVCYDKARAWHILRVPSKPTRNFEMGGKDDQMVDGVNDHRHHLCML